MPPLTESNASVRRRRRETDGSSVEGNPKDRPRTSSATDELPLVKCVLVGDGTVGKTSILVSYSKSECPPPDNYVPTAFDNYSVVVQIDGRPIKLQLCDTAGQDELESLRTLCYTDSDVFLLCFSVVCHASFLSITTKWLPEIRRHCPSTVPILLVGTQCDLRNDPTTLAELDKYNERPIAEASAQRLAKDVGSVMYMECSALASQGVKDVFDAAIFAALDRQGFVRKCRGLGSIRGGSKKYRCRSKLWQQQNSPDGIIVKENEYTAKKQRKRWKLLSCIPF